MAFGPIHRGTGCSLRVLRNDTPNSSVRFPVAHFVDALSPDVKLDPIPAVVDAREIKPTFRSADPYAMFDCQLDAQPADRDARRARARSERRGAVRARAARGGCSARGRGRLWPDGAREREG